MCSIAEARQSGLFAEVQDENAILSRDGTLYSCRRLREAQQRGHQIEILDPLSCYMNVSPVASSIHYKGVSCRTLMR